ncbi:cell division/cell wall cluster transcriptional repressor MraZ [Rickettsiella grylli]|uniref:division/cell wall cluster transcriptional repressor MraZ n=1 Tax=Rickettsiella grylli TaxID=59196 RepID=UPI0008FD5868|nr:division/cell wall cluster transcriptional repressor MraZ [Rickettsiella grylli]OJA00419.1 cell division/cell wall cluster transcriptional repressor MraZ [Rickettsiella grylli]
MFRGINLVVLDSKGRMKLPARYRQRLPLDKEPQFVLTIDTESPCLLLYLLPEWENIEEKLQTLPSFNPAARRIQRLLIGHATDLESDNKGRILLPVLLRDYAQLEKEIMVVGQGRKIELWAASTWEDYRTQWVEETVTKDAIPDELKNLTL